MEFELFNHGEVTQTTHNARTATSLKPKQRMAFRHKQLPSILLLIACIVVLQGRLSTGYYHEFPSILFGRAGHPNYTNGRRKPLFRKHKAPEPECIRLKASRDENSDGSDGISDLERRLTQRITRLEALVAKQEIEIHRLKKNNEELTASAEAFAQVIQVLREAGIQSDVLAQGGGEKNVTQSEEGNEIESTQRNISASENQQPGRVVESFDDSLIFGTAPSSVNDAADAAGAAILAAVLGGKQRMLVDVRDAELSSDPETLVQFIELAILPIAAGLQGLKSTRNRVKIVFPRVSQLLEYRRTMVLAAPEVVALSTLGFDPVERKDKLVVIVAPAPDDEEGLEAMKELLYPTDSSHAIQQPVVLLNYHMRPVAGLPAEFETAYHLRLLSVKYMSSDVANELIARPQEKTDSTNDTSEDDSDGGDQTENKGFDRDDDEKSKAAYTEGNMNNIDDEALEAAMKHAQEGGRNHGATRAMVIRAFPRPWHIFVDTSPGTDADFEVAATFDEEPTTEELNYAIVECLEGSEQEDEIVAQQMQQALEEGQLDRVSDMIGDVLDVEEEDDESDEDGDDDFDMFEEDSI